MKILMVCLGNICRSPLAEGIARMLIDEAQLEWEVDSAGTSGWHNGDPPDRRSVDIAEKHNIDISQQKSRQLIPADLEDFDLILAMDKSNLQNILNLTTSPQQIEKVKLILNYSQPGLDLEVPDPYYGGPEGFEHVYQLLMQACSKIIEVHHE